MTGANLGDRQWRKCNALDPSDANPQYTGSAIINSVDYFGVADGNGNTAAVVSVTADLDRRLCKAGVMHGMYLSVWYAKYR